MVTVFGSFRMKNLELGSKRDRCFRRRGRAGGLGWGFQKKGELDKIFPFVFAFAVGLDGDVNR